MRDTVTRFAATILLALPLARSAAQTPARTVAQDLAAGSAAYRARDATGALADYEAALALAPRDYDALWRAARSGVDLGEFEPDRARRAALFSTATDRARLAVAVNPGGADGHFVLARALGRMALSLGVRDRVKYAGEIRTQALECLRIRPTHPGCLHVMGEWNAEVMRLNGFQRMFASHFLGGQVFGTASWKEALRYMLAAVENDPRRVVHRLDLARVYRDMGQTANARLEYEAVLSGPLIDYNDPHYKAQAAAELKKL